MEEKRCPEAGCGGVLEQEKNANKRTQIFVCVKCDGRYYLEKGKLLKTKDCEERMKKTKNRVECGCTF
jgi:biopolymer transport protein ExbD